MFIEDFFVVSLEIKIKNVSKDLECHFHTFPRVPKAKKRYFIMLHEQLDIFPRLTMAMPIMKVNDSFQESSFSTTFRCTTDLRFKVVYY